MKQLIIFTVLVLLFAMLCGFVPTSEDAMIYDNMVRLHVVANSNSDEDQAIKLSVRDAVIEDIGKMVEEAESAADAANIISSRVFDIRDMVKAELCRLGCYDDVVVSISQESYPTKDYGEISLPAGKYTSLRIEIGAAQGNNWWCVLYPVICTSSAKAGYVLKQTGFSPDQIKILTDGEKPVYKIKFKILELIGDRAG